MTYMKKRKKAVGIMKSRSDEKVSWDAVVIGGGPAGMMAAITAGNLGKKVLLLEKNNAPGKKLRITGKGRCNVTNACDIRTLMENIPCNGRFLYSAFSRFGTGDVMDFFESRGVSLKVERGNRVFPVSDQAGDIVDCMCRAVKEAGVTVRQETVSELLLDMREDSAPVLSGVVCKDGRVYHSGQVVIACGGCSYPLTGSTGDGYALAGQAGHSIVPPKPSLAPLAIREKCCRDMMGLSLKNVVVTVQDTVSEKKIFEEQGEMLFTHFGVSGPLILSASSHIREMKDGRYRLHIDLKPGLSPEKLDARLQRDLSDGSNKDFGNLLRGLLPAKMVEPLAERAGISTDQKAHSVTRQERQRLAGILKDFSLTIRAFRPIEEAIVTSGGVSVREVDPKTMASKKLPGLFFAGEVLDVDGYTGGFNLQIAFSTGYAAGSGL